MPVTFYLGVALVALSSAASAQQVVGDDRAPTPTTMQPFYLEQIQGARRADASGGWNDKASLLVIARVVDSTTVRSESRGPDAEHRLQIREIYYPDDHHVTLWDAVKLKTTWPADPETVRWQRAEDPSPNCIGSERAQFERSESVEGELALVSTDTSSTGYRFTFWRAPKLACEPLLLPRRKSRRRQRHRHRRDEDDEAAPRRSRSAALRRSGRLRRDEALGGFDEGAPRNGLSSARRGASAGCEGRRRTGQAI